MKVSFIWIFSSKIIMIYFYFFFLITEKTKTLQGYYKFNINGICYPWLLKINIE